MSTCSRIWRAHVIRLHSRKAPGATSIPACIIARASARPPVTPTAARTVASLLYPHPAKSTSRPSTTAPIPSVPLPQSVILSERRICTYSAPLDLPPLEDTASIQLALIDVLQALAANQLDPKRAGLLLYGLQVASANVQKMHIPISGSVRSVTFTENGTPLAPQDYGYDIEDYDDEEDEDEDEDENSGPGFSPLTHGKSSIHWAALCAASSPRCPS